MTGAISRTTSNYAFNIIRFDTPRWQTYEHANWDKLDAILALALGNLPTIDAWENNTLYAIGQNAIDLTENMIYSCLVEHTSSGTGTFADERGNNPTFWSAGASLGALAYKDQIGPVDVVDGAVTNAKLATMLAGTIKARLSGDGPPVDTTVEEMKTALGITATRNRILNPGMTIHAWIAFNDEQFFPSGDDLGCVSEGTYFVQSGTGAVKGTRIALTGLVGGTVANRYGVHTTDTSIGSAEFYALEWAIEAADFADIASGSLKKMTFCATVRMPAGTYAISLYNPTANKSLVRNITIAPADANSPVRITEVFDVTDIGTLPTSPIAVALYIDLILAAGSASQTATQNTWQSGRYSKTSAQTNFMGTGGNYVYIQEMGLYLGSAAPQWEEPNAADEWVRCERIYQTVSLYSGSVIPSARYDTLFLPTVMRDTPSIELVETTWTADYDITPVDVTNQALYYAETVESSGYGSTVFTLNARPYE